MDTLQNLCICKIVSLFERFHHVYSTTTDKYLQRGFLFLQKKYSHDLAIQLGYYCKLREKYADFIFNEYVRLLDTEWLLEFSWEAIVKIFKQIGPNLETVRFHRDRVPWDDVVCHLPNVTNIVYMNRCKDSTLRCIAKFCPRLSRLDITGSRCATDNGLKYFYQLRNGNDDCLADEGRSGVPCPLLKEIKVHNTSIRNETVTQLFKNLPLLEYTDYKNLPIVLHEVYKEDMDALDKVRRYPFVDLNLSMCKDFAHTLYYSDILKVCVTLCPNVKTLCCPIFNLEHLNFCSALINVEDLQLRCVGDLPVDVSCLLKRRGEKLNRLILRSCTVSLSVLGQYCPHLEKLTLDKVLLYKESESALVFKKLQIFESVNPDLSDYGNCKAICRILTSVANLKYLYLVGWTSFSLEMRAAVLRCCKQCSLEKIFVFFLVEIEFLKDVISKCSNLLMLGYTGPMNVIKDLRRFARSLPRNQRPSITKYGDSSDGYRLD